MFRKALDHFKTARDRALIGFAGLLTGLALTAAVAQGVTIVTQVGTPSGPAITGIADPLSGVYFGQTGAVNRVGIAGHLEGGLKLAGGVPVATICGAQPAAGSTDTAGTIVNVGTTTCTLTFGTAYVAAPSCLVLDGNTTHAIGVVISNTAITITGGTAADTYTWFCMAKSGG